MVPKPRKVQELFLESADVMFSDKLKQHPSLLTAPTFHPLAPFFRVVEDNLYLNTNSVTLILPPAISFFKCLGKAGPDGHRAACTIPALRQPDLVSVSQKSHHKGGSIIYLVGINN